MILIELVGGYRGYNLEFHPRVTVVAGLSAPQRRDLAASLAGAIGGADVGLVLTVDVAGIPQTLTSDVVARLGLARAPVDNVVEPFDLPGAIVRGVDGAVSSARGAMSGNDDGPLADARAELSAAESEVDALVVQLEVARREAADGAAATELETAEAALVDANDRLTAAREKRDTMPSGQLTPEQHAAHLDRLRQVRAVIAERIAELRAALSEEAGPDPRAVRRLLETIVRTSGHRDRTSGPSPTELADEWRGIVAALGKIAQNRSSPPQWLVAQVKGDRDQAKTHLVEVEKRFAEGAADDVAVEGARQAFADAEDAWSELFVDDAEQKALEQQGREIHRRAIALLGTDPGISNLEDALRFEHKHHETELERPRHELAELFRAAGTNVQPAGVVDLAGSWLARYDERMDDQHRLREKIATAAVDLRDVDRQIAAFVCADGDGSDDETSAEVARLDIEIAELEREVHHWQQGMGDRRAAAQSDPSVLARLDQQLRAARLKADGAAGKVDYLARLRSLQRPQPATAGEVGEAADADAVPVPEPDPYSEPLDDVNEARPWWEGGPAQPRRAVPVTADVSADLTGVTDEDAELYVLSRAAGLRHLGRGESVPLVIDAAFDDLPGHVARRVLDVLPKIAPVVQVIYLAANDHAAEWANRQDEMIAAVVRPVGHNPNGRLPESPTGPPG